ncbi:hypothetical protein BDV59DRAFT_170146 [Aspergillus ambiguus]|uniref:uncharacterized protein n=1 Tax=Aspergillus ambiguus TaxID=176160 RepID=UPI003CCD16CA
MPLHLLGKKSWNVYNPENIARVRRDEAQAKAREEEEERRMQEADAERRIKILRGERPPTPPPAPRRSPSPAGQRKSHREDIGGSRKRRRLAGETDTDRDIRVAREDAELALAKREELASFQSSDAPLHDDAGHINLFPSKSAQRKNEKNEEAEKESADRQRAYEDQYTMRFSNAAGFRQSVGQTPWYSSSGKYAVAPEPRSDKDVWGNEDPMRRERDKARMDANDPLAAMRKGVQQLKEVEQERKKWNEERSRELEALKEAERGRSHRHRRRSSSADSLDGFELDASPERHKDREHRSHRDHRHRHRHRHRRDGSRSRSHRTHTSTSKSHRDRHGRSSHGSRYHGESSTKRRERE